MPEYAIIVAGGIGSRMNQTVAKQFILLNNLPILMYDAQDSINTTQAISLIVGLPANQFQIWQNLCEEYSFTIPHQTVAGGDTRFQTVKNCLNHIEDDEKSLVAIHDGVRPLVPVNIISASFSLATKDRGSVASVRLKETIRFIDQDTSRAVDRSKYRVIQTPQTFNLSSLKKAYCIKEEPWMTDDASVAEQAGIKISLLRVATKI